MTNMTIAGRLLSVAISSVLAAQLADHLSRPNDQEDLCFVIWRPSSGTTRTTAIVADAIWPADGERFLHGNASFTSAYFLRAAALAAEAGGGLGLSRSHPQGTGWQGLSPDDHAAEAGHAAQAIALTGLSLLGLTDATGDVTYSARLWHRISSRQYAPAWCESVRLVGDRTKVSWNDRLRAVPWFRSLQARTVSAWGPAAQADLARLHIGIIGGGSVGALVAEALARVGIEWITLLDFDPSRPPISTASCTRAPATPASRAPRSRHWRGHCVAPPQPSTRASRRWTCRSPNPPGSPPHWTATCCVGDLAIRLWR